MIQVYICNELIEETARHKLVMAPLGFELRRKHRLILEL